MQVTLLGTKGKDLIITYPRYNLVEVTRSDSLDGGVWVNRKDSDYERSMILNRIEGPHPA